jgi:hypothetical protein
VGVGMYSFKDDWAAEIAEVSTLPEFQNATIRIEDESLLTYGEYNVEAGEQEVTGNAVVYQGQARLIGIRWGTFTGGESQANSTTLSAIRIQVPNARLEPGAGDDGYGSGGYDGGLTGRVKRGCKVFVEAAPKNPSLENRILVITSDFQGSSSAARTFEAAFGSDAVVQP